MREKSFSEFRSVSQSSNVTQREDDSVSPPPEKKKRWRIKTKAFEIKIWVMNSPSLSARNKRHGTMRNEAKQREIKKAIKNKLFHFFYDSDCRCASKATGWWRQCRAEHRGTVSRQARRRILPPFGRWRLPWCCEVRHATVVKFAFLWSFHDQNTIKIFFI